MLLLRPCCAFQEINHFPLGLCNQKRDCYFQCSFSTGPDHVIDTIIYNPQHKTAVSLPCSQPTAVINHETPAGSQYSLKSSSCSFLCTIQWQEPNTQHTLCANLFSKIAIATAPEPNHHPRTAFFLFLLRLWIEPLLGISWDHSSLIKPHRNLV